MKFNKILLLILVVGAFITSCTTTPKSDSKPDTKSETVKTKSTDNDSGDSQQVSDQKKPEKLESHMVTDSVMLKRYEAAKTEKPTEEQKAVGMKICNCMKSVKVYSKVVKAKSQEEFNKLAGEDAYDDVLTMQKCHSKFMKPAIKGMSLMDGGIFAFKSRSFLEKQCMDSNPQLWFYIGDYVVKHRPQK